MSEIYHADKCNNLFIHTCTLHLLSITISTKCDIWENISLYVLYREIHSECLRLYSNHLRLLQIFFLPSITTNWLAAEAYKREVCVKKIFFLMLSI